MAFATLALSELALVFGIRSTTTAAWRLEVNRWLVASCVASAAFVIVVYAPFTQDVFSTTALSPTEAAAVVLLSLLPIIGIEIAKAIARHREAGHRPVPAVAGPEHRRAHPAQRGPEMIEMPDSARVA